MSRVLSLGALFALFAALACAETWTGRLIDANCYDQQTEQKNIGACVPTTATSSFAVYTAGKLFKLDEQGNTKAAAAIKDRADRSMDPQQPASGNLTVKVTGSVDQEGKLKVETLEVQ